MTDHMKECPNCHNANKYGDYEGPTCEVCLGDGFVPDEAHYELPFHEETMSGLASLTIRERPRS